MQRTFILLAILIVGIAIFTFNIAPTSENSLRPDDIAFAVQDTAQIGSIRLTEVIEGKDQSDIVLSRGQNGIWSFNGKHTAFQPRIDQFLSVLRNVHVKQILAEKGQKSARKIIGLTHTRVEISDREGDLIKEYLLSTQAKDGKGTLMQLDEGMPVIVELPGLQGFVNGFYTMDRLYWRENLLFDARLDSIKSISVAYADARKPFLITRLSPQNSWLMAQPEDELDTDALNAYLAVFSKKIYAESFAEYTYPGQKAALENQPPDVIFSVEYFNGESRQILLFERSDNPNNYFGWVKGPEELLTIQRYVFDKFLVDGNELRASLIK
ncbi:MAG: hypothetical protein AAF206_00460 [Bacteroidota bacterium]